MSDPRLQALNRWSVDLDTGRLFLPSILIEHREQTTDGQQIDAQLTGYFRGVQPDGTMHQAERVMTLHEDHAFVLTCLFNRKLA